MFSRDFIKTSGIFLVFCVYSIFLYVNISQQTPFYELTPKEYLNIIGYHTMTVANRIFMPSNEIKISETHPITRNDLEIPQYTDSVFIKHNDDPGYMPRKYEFSGTCYFVLHDVVCTTEIVIIKENGYHLFKRACHPRYWGIGLPYHTPEVNCPIFEKVICIGHQHSSDWGHWSIEVLPGLISLPESVLEDAIIALPRKDPAIVYTLSDFGIDHCKVYAEDNGRFKANTLITIHSIWCGDHNRFLILNMRQVIKKRFKLDKIKPYRYIIANRQMKTRCIKNFDELFGAVSSAFPKYTFEKFILYTTFEEQVKYFNTFKLFFGVHGSHMANILYMQPGTAFVELQMERWLLSFITMSTMTGKIHVTGRDNSFSFTEPVPQMINIDYALKLIGKGIELLEKH